MKPLIIMWSSFLFFSVMCHTLLRLVPGEKCEMWGSFLWAQRILTEDQRISFCHLWIILNFTWKGNLLMLKIKCKDETVLISRQLKSLEFFLWFVITQKLCFWVQGLIQRHRNYVSNFLHCIIDNKDKYQCIQ